MARANNRKKNWMILIAIIIMGLLYVKFSAPANPYSTARDEVGKTETGGLVDFTGPANKVHGAVDEVLKKNGVSMQDLKEMAKTVPRQSAEGVIRWHTRQILIVMPSDLSTETLQQSLQTGIKNVGGQVITTQNDNYQGIPVLRLDIGFKDKVAGEEVTIISDRVYLSKEKGTAVLPNKSAVKGHGQMAIIIDDFGYSKEPISAFAAIARPLTFAILPYHPFSSEAATKGLSSGHEILLHLPMEPLARAEQSEKSTIGVAMSDEEIQEMTQKAIDTIPGLIGVNNHQGSRATADKRVMKVVLGQIKAAGLFFIDSRTNAQSVGAESARQMGVKTGENEMFIDNSDDVSAIKGKLHTAQEIALKHGSVTVIGHAHMNTAAAVSEMIPELESNGIQLVFVSQLVR